jgi:hypothetical protein
MVVAHLSLFGYWVSPWLSVTDLDLSKGLFGMYRTLLEGGRPVLDHHVMPR